MIQRSRTALGMRRWLTKGTPLLAGLPEREALVFHMDANKKLLREDVTHLDNG